MNHVYARIVWEEADPRDDFVLEALVLCDLVDPGFVYGTPALLIRGCRETYEDWILDGPDHFESAFGWQISILCLL